MMHLLVNGSMYLVVAAHGGAACALSSSKHGGCTGICCTVHVCTDQSVYAMHLWLNSLLQQRNHASTDSNVQSELAGSRHWRRLSFWNRKARGIKEKKEETLSLEYTWPEDPLDGPLSTPLHIRPINTLAAISKSVQQQIQHLLLDALP